LNQQLKLKHEQGEFLSVFFRAPFLKCHFKYVFEPYSTQVTI
jgi:hypothetical protein